MGDSVRFDYQHEQSVTIISGADSMLRLADYFESQQANQLNVLVVTTQGHCERGTLQPLLQQLQQHRVTVIDSIQPNPDLDDLDQLIDELTVHQLDVVIGIGGGSVLDAAKVLACSLDNGNKQPLQRRFRAGETTPISRSCKLIAIPTTAGTGAEVTPFATVWDSTNLRKHSLSGAAVAPDIAVLLPQLTQSLPYHETLFTGLDTLSHSLESLWNKQQTPISEAYARQALRLTCIALPQVLAAPDNLSARALMQQASVLAGLAISQTRTALAHSISYPLTLHYQVPHGLACSFTLPGIIDVLKEAQQGEPKLAWEQFEQALELMRQLPLADYLQRYASWEQIESLQEFMQSKQRSDNFITPVTEALVARVLTKSRAFLESA
ncbi:MAG: phosphonoacetaldehyde reductase [Idiomarina sp.]